MRKMVIGGLLMLAVLAGTGPVMAMKPAETRSLSSRGIASSGYLSDCINNGGSHYSVTSTAGFNLVTGWLTWGTAKLTSSNTVAYQSLGVETPKGNVDVGFFNNGDDIWRPATWDSKQRWLSGSMSIPQAKYPKVYVKMRVGDDKITLTVIDNATWQTIGEEVFTLPGLGLNSRAAGVQIYRFDALAQHRPDCADGSSLRNAQWDGLYLYRAAPAANPFYTPWSSRYTSGARKAGDTSKVYINSQAPYSASNITVWFWK